MSPRLWCSVSLCRPGELSPERGASKAAVTQGRSPAAGSLAAPWSAGSHVASTELKGAAKKMPREAQAARPQQPPKDAEGGSE